MMRRFATIQVESSVIPVPGSSWIGAVVWTYGGERRELAQIGPCRYVTELYGQAEAVCRRRGYVTDPHEVAYYTATEHPGTRHASASTPLAVEMLDRPERRRVRR